MPAKIFESIEDAVTHLNIKHGSQRIVYTTSGGFDPLHVGHLRCIQETVRMAIEHQQQDLEAPRTRRWTAQTSEKSATYAERSAI